MDFFKYCLHCFQSVVGNLWMQRDDYIYQSMLFWIRGLEYLRILIFSERSWNQTTTDTERQLKFLESQKLYVNS